MYYFVSIYFLDLFIRLVAVGPGSSGMWTCTENARSFSFGSQMPNRKGMVSLKITL